MRRISACFLVPILALASCSLQKERAQLAQEATIDPHAPVKAVLDQTIDAPPERVWALLSSINGWPKWHSAITAASIKGPTERGNRFTWTTGGTEIHSTLVLVQAPTDLVWTGKAIGATAIHIWKLRPLPNNKTLVHMEESMNGLLLRFFYSSKDLAGSDQGWLDDLKTAEERP